MAPDPARLNEFVSSLSGPMEPIRTLTLATGFDWFDLVARAALAKNYDFTAWAVSGFKEASNAVEPFYVIATLRGIVEDIIVLTAISQLPRQDRDHLLQSWMQLNVVDGTSRQATFFAVPDRMQAVLTPPPDHETIAAGLKHTMREIWRSNGINPGPAGTGNIRDLAKSASLLELYDYIYAFASRLVHFSPSVLLRMGWGEQRPEEAISGSFRVAHFRDYYAEIASVYSVLLLAEFIDHLGTSMGLPHEFANCAQDLRQELRKGGRIPELVTYEEMNLPPPPIFLQAFAMVMREGKFPQGSDE